MKRLFVKARQRALDEISELLADFRNKRTLGLGSVFGENLLNDLKPGDRQRELRIVEHLLMAHFDNTLSNGIEFEQLPDRLQVILSSLATILRGMGIKMQASIHDKLLDKCPSYIAKDKGMNKFKIAKVASKKVGNYRDEYFIYFFP